MSQIVHKKVLFICTHNSARSQMAEGLLNMLYQNQYQAHSAGTEPSQVNPYAIKAMAEIGIDISTHHSKSIEEYQGMQFDIVITVCDDAKDSCPFFPGNRIIHQSFEDPSACGGTVDNILNCFRRIRDEIKEWLEITFGE